MSHYIADLQINYNFEIGLYQVINFLYYLCILIINFLY